MPPPRLTHPGNQTVQLLCAIWSLLMSLSYAHGIPQSPKKELRSLQCRIYKAGQMTTLKSLIPSNSCGFFFFLPSALQVSLETK